MEQLATDLWNLVWQPAELPENLAKLVEHAGSLSYAALFLIVFCETGLVVTPFLPGDSLLFVVGFVCATVEHAANKGGTSPAITVQAMAPVLMAAALLGDNVNYWLGRTIGPRAFTDNRRWLKRKHLERAHAFFERHGGRAVVLARFVPIVRTFMPFVAGIGAMSYRRFLAFSVAGAALWIVLLMGAGYLLGDQPFVQAHFEKFVVGIVVVSVLPVAIELWRGWRAARRAARA